MKNGWIYLLGGEEGFLLPPFGEEDLDPRVDNDVWHFSPPEHVLRWNGPYRH